MPLGSFLNTDREEHQKNSRQSRETASDHTVAQSHEVSNKPAFPIVGAYYPHVVVGLNVIDKGTATHSVNPTIGSFSRSRLGTGCGVSNLTT